MENIKLSTLDKYLLLIPFVLIISFCVIGHLIVVRSSQQSMLMEKYVDVVAKVDMLAAAVDANPERHWEDHEHNIRDSVEFLDRLHQIYAAVYKPINGVLELISERTFETSIYEPFSYAEFIEAIEQDSGGLVIGYSPIEQARRDLHIYFRWMPLYAEPGERFLVVAGVSKYSILNKPLPSYQ